MDEKPTSIRILNRKKSKPPKCFLDSEKDVVEWILSPLDHEERELFQATVPQEDKHSKQCTNRLIAASWTSLTISPTACMISKTRLPRLITENAFRESIDDTHCLTFLDALKRNIRVNAETRL